MIPPCIIYYIDLQGVPGLTKKKKNDNNNHDINDDDEEEEKDKQVEGE